MFKLYFAIAVVIMLVAPCDSSFALSLGPPYDDPPPINIARKCSLVDASGTTIIPPVYFDIQPLEYGFFVCRTVDERSETKPKLCRTDVFDYDGIKYSHSQLEQAREEQSKISGTYSRNLPLKPIKFPDGLGPIRKNSLPRLWGYARPSLEIAIPQKYVEVHQFSEGYAAVRTTQLADYPNFIYIDVRGKKVSPNFSSASDFVGDHAIVALGKGQSPTSPIRFGVIDSKFKTTVVPQYEKLQMLTENLFFAVPFKGRSSFLIDANNCVKTKFSRRYSDIRIQGARSWFCNNPKDSNENPHAERFAVADINGSILQTSETNRDEIYRRANPPLNSPSPAFDEWTKGRKLQFKTKNGKKIEVFSNDSKRSKFGLTVVYVNDKHVPFKFRTRYRPMASVVDDEGNVLISAQRCDYTIIDEHRLIRTAYKDKVTRSDCENFGITLQDISALLRDFNLIGMTKNELLETLGQDVSKERTGIYVYKIRATDSQLTHAVAQLQFKFIRDKIDSWRLQFLPESENEPFKQVPMDWVRTNIVSDYWNPTEFRLKR